MSLQSAETSELVTRFTFLSEKYVDLALVLTEKLEKFGKYRKELQLIAAELASRGITTDTNIHDAKIKSQIDRINNEQTTPNNT